MYATYAPEMKLENKVAIFRLVVYSAFINRHNLKKKKKKRGGGVEGEGFFAC